MAFTKEHTKMAKMTYETFANGKDRLKQIGYFSTGLYSQRAADILMFIMHNQSIGGGVVMRVGSKLNSFAKWIGIFTRVGEKVFVENKLYHSEGKWDIQVDEYGEVLIRLGEIVNFNEDREAVINVVKSNIEAIINEMIRRHLDETTFISASTYSSDMSIRMCELKGILNALNGVADNDAKQMVGYPNNPLDVVYNKATLNKTSELKIELKKVVDEFKENGSTKFNGAYYSKMKELTIAMQRFFMKHVNDNYSIGSYYSYLTFESELNQELFAEIGIDL